ncbi:hypothetical protein GWN42_32580 [candidate division KSB1 bacterium]|nr:hypothetical protein [candidate division KSB1 bacterium]
MKKYIFCGLIFACLGLATMTAHAGAWLQERGGYYVKFSFNSFSTSEQFSFAGDRQPLNSQFSNIIDSEFSDRNLTVYAELGLMDWFTAVVTTSFKKYSTSGFNTTDQLKFDNDANGIGDLYLGGRVRLLAQPLVLSLQPIVKLPTGSDDSAIPRGTGSTDVELRLQVGTVFPLPLHNYFTGDIGYTRRGGQAFHDEVPYFAEFGIFPVSTLILKAAIDGRKSTETISTQAAIIGDSSQNMLIADQDFTQLWGGVLFNVKPSVQLSLEFSTFIAGNNTLAGETIALGVAFISP